MGDAICPLLVLVGFFGGVVWIVRGLGATRAGWQKLSQDFGVESSYVGGRLQASGRIDQTSFTYRTAEKWHELATPIPREEIGDLRVAHESGLDKIAKKLGAQDITFGDPTFDDKWRVTCREPQLAKNVLRRSARVALYNTQSDLGFSGVLEVSAGNVRWTSLSPIPPETVPSIVRALGECATALASDAPDDDDDSGSTS